MKYRQITISTTAEFSELAAAVLHEAGSVGVSVTDFDEFRRVCAAAADDYVAEGLFQNDPGAVLVCGFFDKNFNKKVIEDALNLVASRSPFDPGALEIVSELLDSADYENEWKKYYAPIKIGGVTIVPSWLAAPDNGTVPVFLNPGAAFGTGSHETTAMCVALLQRVPLIGKRVADVGCGSGILGLAALALGAKNCTFIDSDAAAVAAAKENCARNGVLSACKIIKGDLLRADGDTFDICLANLTADVLLRLYERVAARLKAGGALVIGGIIRGRENGVLQKYSDAFSVESESAAGEWSAYLLKRK
ncbi:MAG: 50S ribosomal protein L11 methyltransferase [Clostridiales bacterium]|jgi:ribosomal protein L11 methyltransferase|nr:50S ribosomal protein L11 methyltransferase [Clostridiales bacterium]